MNEKNSLNVPAAIVVGAVIIALAIVATRWSGPRNANTVPNEAITPAITIDPVTEKDHILGNPNADLVFIEYSDLECPFCKQFHSTLKRLVDEYGKSGKMAWVYRHFPLAQLHPKAVHEAVATECAAELGGNTAFWTYTNRLFEITPANNGLDEAKLPELAAYAGLDVTAFNECLTSNRTEPLVAAQYESGIKAGARGTPYTVILLKNKMSEKSFEALDPVYRQIVDQSGKRLVNVSEDRSYIIMSGALPYEVFTATFAELAK